MSQNDTNANPQFGTEQTTCCGGDTNPQFRVPPTQNTSGGPITTGTTQPRSATTAYLLWFFLGGFGAHRFYFGKTRGALGMIALCVVSFLLAPFIIGLFGYAALAIWWLFDALRIGNWVAEANNTAAETARQPMSRAA